MQKLELTWIGKGDEPAVEPRARRNPGTRVDAQPEHGTNEDAQVRR
ncbi:MAG: hypothetical protein LBO03_10310 [Acidaminococcales bacterium]|jgi:hypothetical protein|nr:hypothetical protein [Acidaminococcales bacterium]